jgi:hypothetical protein
MRLIAPLILAAAILPCSAQAQDADYPVSEVLTAFATACSGVDDTTVNIASAEAAGWEQLAPDVDAPVSKLARREEAELLATAPRDGEMPPELITGLEFRREVAGRTLYLAISGIKYAKFMSRRCLLYDFDAPRGFTTGELEDWAVRRPDVQQSLPGGISWVAFEPGLKPGQESMDAYFVPPPGTDPVARIFKFVGICLVARASQS